MIKCCNQCHKSKSIDEFYADRSASDGRSRICKDCAKIKRRKYYVQNRERILFENRIRWREENSMTDEIGLILREKRLKKKREYYNRNKSKLLAQTAEWRRQHPEKVREYNAKRSR